MQTFIDWYCFGIGFRFKTFATSTETCLNPAKSPNYHNFSSYLSQRKKLWLTVFSCALRTFLWQFWWLILENFSPPSPLETSLDPPLINGNKFKENFQYKNLWKSFPSKRYAWYALKIATYYPLFISKCSSSLVFTLHNLRINLGFTR